jgi:hypothetical protein
LQEVLAICATAESAHGGPESRKENAQLRQEVTAQTNLRNVYQASAKKSVEELQKAEQKEDAYHREDKELTKSANDLAEANAGIRTL